MKHTESLTFAAQQEMNVYIAKLIEASTARLNAWDTKEALMEFLVDDRFVNTPGFVLRRHIQSRGLLSDSEPCADLGTCGNIPWSESTIRQAAMRLSSITHADRMPDSRGGDISTENWKRYLTDAGTQGIQRKMLFHLAVVTKMNREETIELLMAADQPVYNLREPMELICYYFQKTPERYGWKDVQRLLARWEALREENNTGSAPECSGEVPAGEMKTKSMRAADPSFAEGSSSTEESYSATLRLQITVENILTGSLPAAAAEDRLFDLMREQEHEFGGFSHTVRQKLEELLNTVFLLYRPQEEEKETGLFEKIERMLESQNWDLEDFAQNGARGNDRKKAQLSGGALQSDDEDRHRRERYVFREDWGILYESTGKFALFCKRYYQRMHAILSGKKSADRRDVLLFGYFLIAGYREASDEVRSRFWNQMEKAGKYETETFTVSRRIADLYYELESLRNPEIMTIRDRKDTCLRILNELLSGFSYHPFYPPSFLDRMVLLALLHDRPDQTIGYLLGIDEEERE